MRLGGLRKLIGIKDSVESLDDLQFPLCAYGKLGFYKDYIRLKCGVDPAARFRVWLDEGFGATFEEFGGRQVSFKAPVRMLANLHDREHFAIATVWPSADEGGLREFPFAFYTIAPIEALGDPGSPGAWALLESVWNALERHFELVTTLSAVSGFYDRFKDESIPTDSSGADPGDPLSLSAFMRGLNPQDAEATASRLTEAMKNFIAEAKSLSNLATELAVRAPSSRAEPLGEQIRIWLQAFGHHLDIGSQWPSLILPVSKSGAAAPICMIWRKLQKQDALLFATDLDASELIDDFTTTLSFTDQTQNEKPLSDEERESQFDLNIELDQWISMLG